MNEIYQCPLESHSLTINTPQRFNLPIQKLSYLLTSNRYLFKNINLTIPFNTKLAIQGPTGSGKSTFAKSIVKLMLAQQIKGNILIDKTIIFITHNQTSLAKFNQIVHFN